MEVVFGDLEAEGKSCVSVEKGFVMVDDVVVFRGVEGDVEPGCDACFKDGE